MTAVHQLLPVFSPGDAIGNAVIATRRMLRALGFRSEIFAEGINPALRRHARPADSIDSELTPDGALLYHLSIGSPLARVVEQAPGRRVLVFHNVTPPHYYRDVSARVVYWLERGLADLRRLAPAVDLTIADSRFNLEDARAAGARHAVVIPPALDIERLTPSHTPALERAPVVLAVGRLAPSKRQDTLIRALAALHATGRTDVRLRVLGGSGDTEVWLGGLRRLAEALGVADAVEMTGLPVTDSVLSRAYADAAVLACPSEHEGFCVPLVEAMAFGLPIVARAAGAVPETLGDAGLLVDGDDPLVWAAVIARVLDDECVRAVLSARGRDRLGAFGEDAARGKLADALASIGLRGAASR